MARFDGRVALVTGGGSGIGRATALEFAREGAAVAILDLNSGAARSVAAEAAALGTESLAIVADVGLPDDCRRAVAEAEAVLGPVYVLVNAAATFLSRGIDTTPEEWEQVFAVNVRASALLVAAVAGGMRRAGGGAIVNLASISGHIAQPGRWTYNTSKGAILALTRGQAMDLARDGIRVNSVSPGTIWTPQVDRESGGDRARWEPVYGAQHMLGRCGEPEEVARAILFLCSDDASFITGADLAVDGGYLAKSHDVAGEGARSR